MIAAALLFIKGLSWQTYVIAALVAICLGVYAEKTAHVDLLEHELASMTKDRDALKKEIADAKQLAIETDAIYRTAEQKRVTDQKEISNEAQRLTTRARSDSSAVSTALGKLLDRAVASSGQASSDPPAAQGGPAVEGGGLRTDLLRSLGGDAQRYADIADQARIAGQACEASYDALTP